MQLLESIQGMGIPTWVRESPSIFAYTFILSMHAIGLAIIVGISSMVALRMVGLFRAIPIEPMLKLIPVMHIGFAINLISGLLLLSANLTGMLAMFMFYLKMALIVAAMGLISLIRRQFGAGKAEHSRGLGFAILGCWFCAVIAGRLTAYPYLVDSWLGI